MVTAVTLVAVFIAKNGNAQPLDPVPYHPPQRPDLTDTNRLDLGRSTYMFQPVVVLLASDPGHAYKLGDVKIVQFAQLCPLGWGFQNEFYHLRIRIAGFNVFYADPPRQTGGGLLLTPDTSLGVRFGRMSPFLLTLTGEFNYRVSGWSDEKQTKDYPGVFAAGGADLTWEVWPEYLRGFPRASLSTGVRFVAVWSEMYESGEGRREHDVSALLYGGRGDFMVPIELEKQPYGWSALTRLGVFLGIGFYTNPLGDRDIQWTVDVRTVMY